LKQNNWSQILLSEVNGSIQTVCFYNNTFINQKIGRVKNELFDGDDILQTFIPKSNNKMHEEDSFFSSNYSLRELRSQRCYFYKYGWDDVRSSSAGYSLKFAKRIVTKSGDS